MRLLLVEDEEILSNIVCKGLRKLGYAVDTAYDGEEALICYEENDYDLILLDLNLPKVDGLQVLTNIRKQDQDINILILSARSEIEDRVLGLDLGANDYLIKPFDFNELEARIRSLVRRVFSQLPVVLTCKNVCLDTSSKSVMVNEVPISLTKKEYSILEYLMLHQNSVLSSEQIIEHVWDNEVDLFSGSFKYHIHSLKKKLSTAGLEYAGIIKNIRGQGYIIEGSDKNVS